MQLKRCYRQLAEIINTAPDPSVVGQIIKHCDRYDYPTETIIDVGVHSYSEAKNYIKCFDRWIGFEPNPQHFARFSQQYPQYTIHPIALGEEQAHMDLYYHEGKWSGVSSLNEKFLQHLDNTSDLTFDDTWKTVQVEVRTLDSYNFPQFNVLKVDTEGWDMRVIKGAVNTIYKYKPLIVAEMINLEYMDMIDYTGKQVNDNWYCVPKDKVWTS